MRNRNQYTSVLIIFTFFLVFPFCVIFSCNSGRILYSPREIRIDTVIQSPSGGYFLVFIVVPQETMYFPGGYLFYSEKDSVFINVVKCRIRSNKDLSLRKIGVVKNSSYLMNVGCNRYTYFIEFDAKDSIFKFCDHNTCGTVINLRQAVSDSIYCLKLQSK